MLLPQSAFSPLATKKLRAPTVLWHDRQRLALADAIEHAYCVPHQDDAPAAYEDGERIQLADRYGGPGIGASGGSGRCAIFGQLQIKGVGRTALVTARQDPLHSNGMLGIEEALCEVIWSEVLQLALPFGAVRTLGALGTGTTFPVRAADGALDRRPRVLLYREWALRPAHYMRNLNFATPYVAAAGVFDDALRTAATVRTLPEAFRSVFAACRDKTSAIEVVNIGMVQLAGRLAMQAASASAKRLFHGGLTPSNIALDGRYLDFGTMTAVPGFRRRAIRPLDIDFWSEQSTLINSLMEMRFYVAKFLDVPDKESLIGSAQLAATFGTRFAASQGEQLLKLTGVPEAVALAFPREQAVQLVRCLSRLITRGLGAPFVTWAGGHGPTHPARGSAHCDVSDLLTRAALCPDSEALRVLCAARVPDPVLAAEFCTLYGALIALYLVTPGADPASLRVQLALQAIRRNADIGFLEERAFGRAIDACKDRPAALPDFIEATVARAGEIVGEQIDIAAGMTRVRRADGAALLAALLPHNAAHIDAGITYQLEQLWNTVP